ncbi:mechanosensitive ion channel domain-containing protein [Roseiconus nitratireducens]|nr:mechanosensitive ion channel domain-containing protein [Roseiconus nitratireducens]
MDGIARLTKFIARPTIRRLDGLALLALGYLLIGPPVHGWTQSAEIALLPGAQRAAVSESAERSQPDAENSVDLETQQRTARQNADRVRAAIEAHRTAGSTAPTDLIDELRLWEEIELVAAQRELVRDELRNAGTPPDTGLRLEDDPPATYLQYDQLRDRLASLRSQLLAIENEWQAEKNLLTLAKRQLLESEQLRRRLNDQIESSVAPQRARLQRQRSLAMLESQLLSSRCELHREQVSLDAGQVAAAKQSVTQLEAVVAAYAGRFIMTQAELNERLARIDELEDQLRQQLDQAEIRLRRAMHPHAAGSDDTAATTYQVAHEESKLLQQTLSEANLIKECWRRRYKLAAGIATAEEIATWLEETRQAKRRIAHIAETIQLRNRQRQEKLIAIGGTEVIGTTQSVAPAAARQVDELKHMVGIYGSIQALATNGGRLIDRFIEDLEATQRQFSLADWTQLALGGLLAAWEYELTSIDDEPITVRKIVFGLTLLFLGYLFSRALATLLASRLLPRFGLSEAAISVFRTLSFYAMLTALVLLSLDLVNVPLTVFAFLGGAVAIGLGFGSQNLINNFISGLILLAERPIRVGDLVNVDGIDANVTNIGARSTRVRTGANLEILVPNSRFLENNVTNWTLSDTRIRTSVCVGVAYGSPVKEVLSTLRQVIDAHPRVLRAPEPIVLFQDFGDNSLAFEAHFWIHMRQMMDAAKVRSELRVAIDEAFRERSIVIAFPQRDVHLDIQSPVEVRLADHPAPGLAHGTGRHAA